MRTELPPKKVRQETPAPTRGVRLAWWFGIYFSGLVPLVIAALENEINILAPILFPLPLGFLLVALINLLPGVLGQILLAPLFFAGLAFYIAHLYATLRVPTRRRFDFLLLILVIVVLINQWLVAMMATSIRM